MSEFLHAIKTKWQNSSFRKTFNLNDEKAKGRDCLLASSILSSLATQLSGGAFYIGFLICFGMNTVNIGIIIFVPMITRLLAIFSPLILERLRRRKVFLTVLAVLANVFNILGVTLLPDLITSQTGRVVGFTLLVTISTAISAIIDSGYSAWHIPYLPNDVRADYYTLTSGISGFFTQTVVLIVSLIIDSFAGSSEQIEIITTFRYIAFALAVLNIVVLAIPKEYPYEPSRKKTKIKDMLVLPLKNKKFLWTVLIVALYYLGFNLTSAAINGFLLKSVGLSYWEINLINAIYFLIHVFFGKALTKSLNKNSRYRILGYALLLQGPTYIMYAFVTSENYIWLWVIVRLMQHVLGVFINSVNASLLNDNIPESDRTNHISFYNLAVHMSCFFSMMLGTLCFWRIGNNVVDIFGFKLAGIPIVLAISGIAQILVGLLCRILNDKLLADDLQNG